MARLLTERGWTIYARNLRHVGCELDIVAGKGETLVILEVKSRPVPPATIAEAEALLGPRKRRALKHGAHRLLAMHPELGRYRTIRFDLAIVARKPEGRPRIMYQVNVL